LGTDRTPSRRRKKKQTRKQASKPSFKIQKKKKGGGGSWGIDILQFKRLGGLKGAMSLQPNDEQKDDDKGGNIYRKGGSPTNGSIEGRRKIPRKGGG